MLTTICILEQTSTLLGRQEWGHGAAMMVRRWAHQSSGSFPTTVIILSQGVSLIPVTSGQGRGNGAPGGPVNTGVAAVVAAVGAGGGGIVTGADKLNVKI